MSFPRKARESALRMLFQWEMAHDAPERVKEVYWENAKTDLSVQDAANHLFDQVLAQQERIDELIRKNAEHWSLERMSAVDRNILRVAVSEFLRPTGLSAAIIINEAVEIARRYSSDDSGNFINGMLDAIRKQVKTEA